VPSSILTPHTSLPPIRPTHLAFPITSLSQSPRLPTETPKPSSAFLVVDRVLASKIKLRRYIATARRRAATAAATTAATRTGRAVHAEPMNSVFRVQGLRFGLRFSFRVQPLVPPYTRGSVSPSASLPLFNSAWNCLSKLVTCITTICFRTLLPISVCALARHAKRLGARST
jgi:hypothetical protein